jgi:phosphoglycerate-specific signal transduction histidine kinase
VRNSIAVTGGIDERRDELVRGAQLVVAGELVRAMIHALRQPLTAASLNLETAARLLSSAPPDTQEALAAVRDAIEDQSEMRRTLLSSCDLVAHHEPRWERVDVAQLVREVGKLAANEAITQRVDLNVTVDDSIPVIQGERMMLRLALLSVLVRRMELARHGRRERRSLRLCACTASANVVEISVASDRGPVPQSDRPSDELELAKVIAELHQGELLTDLDGEQRSVVRLRIPSDVRLSLG